MLASRSPSVPRVRVASIGRHGVASAHRPSLLQNPATLARISVKNVTTISWASHGPRASRWPRLSYPHPRLQTCGKKTKTVVELDDLPQGLIVSSEPLIEEPDEPAYPTVVLQARRNMQKFDNCVLLTRVGGFYELYFEHAEEYGPLLNIKVAQKKTSAGAVPMV